MSVCVFCGEPWEPSIKNVCECGGFCTWGPAKGADPDSWILTPEGWTLSRYFDLFSGGMA